MIPCCQRSRGWRSPPSRLIKLESLGLEVVEFRRLPGEAVDPDAAPPSP
jgi:hypothetical protein